MIQVICPGCGSRLNAKDELAGQTRSCPKCKRPVRIEAAPPALFQPPADDAAIFSADEPAAAGVANAAAAAAASPDAAAPTPAEVGLPSHHFMDRLNRQFHYLILDRTKLFAVWENNGQGWMLKTHTGLASAVRNQQLLPAQGNFRFVELHLEHSEGRIRLTGLASFQLADRWALNCLARSDDEIVERITGRTGLSRDQKIATRNAIKERFMRDVWQDATAVHEFLANGDFHTPGTIAAH
jgi:hypothetical protein